MSLLLQIVTWPTFGITLFVFGFAPGAVLRLIVLAFPQDDPRRRELLAELYHVRRWDRPWWVAEQLEVALYEGLRGRSEARRRRQRELDSLEVVQSMVQDLKVRVMASRTSSDPTDAITEAEADEEIERILSYLAETTGYILSMSSLSQLADKASDK
jgi:hypothetical protein